MSELGRNGTLLRRVTFVVSTRRMQLVRIPCSTGTHRVRIAIVS